jgi:hypothetical protein
MYMDRKGKEASFYRMHLWTILLIVTRSILVLSITTEIRHILSKQEMRLSTHRKEGRAIEIKPRDIINLEIANPSFHGFHIAVSNNKRLIVFIIRHAPVLNKPTIVANTMEMNHFLFRLSLVVGRGGWTNSDKLSFIVSNILASLVRGSFFSLPAFCWFVRGGFPSLEPLWRIQRKNHFEKRNKKGIQVLKEGGR